MLSNHLFEGDLTDSKTSKSNILAPSEILVIEILKMIKEESLLEENENFLDEEVRETQSVLDKTPYFGRYSSLDYTDTEDDNPPIQWLLKKREVSISKKGKEKVVVVESRRRPFTRSYSKKMLADSMKVSVESTAKIQRKRTFKC